jgi:hypothetical protein
MTPSEHDLEKLLRQAPRPSPPPGLRQEILRTAPAEHAPGRKPASTGWLQGWLNSWRFATAAACLALAAIGVAATQQMELRQLRQQVDELRQQLEVRQTTPPADPAPAANPIGTGSPATPAAPRSDRDDLERLRAEAARLQSDAGNLGKLNTENAQLRGELAAMVQQVMPGEFEALREAKQRAQRISCVNNMKQLGLAVRIYANDNKDAFPKDVLSMSNELATTKILVCPSDTNRQAAASWSVFTPANFSYEYLAADGSDSDPTRVLFRCSVHRGSVGLCDGSVQQLSEQMQTQRLVQRDGKLYLDSGPPPTASGEGR